MKPTTDQIRQRALRRHLKKLDEARRCHEAADRALQRALKHGQPIGKPFLLDGLTVEVRDNAARLERLGVIYRPARLPRYTVERGPWSVVRTKD